ncbi:hypothetical protein O3P69_019357 [Scylla paramamosain]|uniref:Uncharacterized protein n=1 Tax=Scylla paramamosain TaxID=85552 RepID=A0AAW0SWA3_SCYPA
MAWDPRSSRLALITGTSHLYFWSPLGTVVVAVPNGPHLHLTSLRWHPFGKCLLANERKHLSVCFLDPPRQPSLKPLPP